MKNKYTINDLYASAWSEAILNVIEYLNKTLGLELNWAEDGNKVETLCEKLGIKFDENNNIIR